VQHIKNVLAQDSLHQERTEHIFLCSTLNRHKENKIGKTRLFNWKMNFLLIRSFWIRGRTKSLLTSSFSLSMISSSPWRFSKLIELLFIIWLVSSWYSSYNLNNSLVVFLGEIWSFFLAKFKIIWTTQSFNKLVILPIFAFIYIMIYCSTCPTLTVVFPGFPKNSSFSRAWFVIIFSFIFLTPLLIKALSLIKFSFSSPFQFLSPVVRRIPTR